MADVQLPFPSISIVHALLTRRFDALEISDLGSLNGIGRPATFLSQAEQPFVRCARLHVYVGDRFALGGVPLLALDAQTHQLIQPLTAYCGAMAHDEVDWALESILQGHIMILHGSRSEVVLELARTLHEHSIRKGFPFTPLDAVPESEPAIEELCTQAGCGTIFLDLTTPFRLPRAFARNLVSDRFHLWTIVVAQVAADAIRCFAEARSEPHRLGFGVCELGFPQTGRQGDTSDLSLTKT